VIETGAEVIAGSTRMKAGTAEKMALNMISTGTMVRLGYVYGNLMVNLHQKNTKLTARAVRIVEQVLGIDTTQARTVLRRAGSEVPVAIVMVKAEVSRSEANKALRSAHGHVRRAIALASSRSRNEQR
jgi:N-acetylmuramic acid 6-phosphate etherase